MIARSQRAFAPWLVYEEHGQVKGYAYGSRHRDRAAYQWSVDVSVYVDETFRRRGIGSALYTALFPLLRLQGFFAAHAGSSLRDRVPEPPPPRPVGEAQRDPPWEAAMAAGRRAR